MGAHVAGIWLAHAEALTLFGSRAAAFRGQAPMVAVMVLFTVSGLWNLEDPHGDVNRRAWSWRG